MTESKNEYDHFDLDHFDHILASLLNYVQDKGTLPFRDTAYETGRFF